MTRHWTARRGIGLSEILACGTPYDVVLRAALKVERHPIMIEVLQGATCAACGYRAPEPVSDGGWL